MWVGPCWDVLFSLLRNVLELSHLVNIWNLIVGTGFEHVLTLLAIRIAEELNWALEGCLSWDHYEYQTGATGDVLAFRRHKSMSAKWKSVCRAVVTTWTMVKASKELERSRQPLVNQNKSVTSKEEDEDGKNAPTWSPVLAQGTPAGSEGQRGISNTGESRDLPDAEVTTVECDSHNE